MTITNEDTLVKMDQSSPNFLEDLKNELQAILDYRVRPVIAIIDNTTFYVMLEVLNTLDSNPGDMIFSFFDHF